LKSRAQLGMLLFLLNEAVLFFMLIAAYVYFHGSTAAAASRNLDLTSAAVFTACLVASSFAMWRAAATARRVWIGATIALGVLFLYGQGNEYWRLFRRNVTISRDQFGTTFFTVTGVHAMHVLIGLLLLALLLRGTASRAMTDSVALYWYFVDAVWIVIFAVVYLWAFL
jgi:heme/copper-type cytochrome/quinol oxidase subunit 3